MYQKKFNKSYGDIKRFFSDRKFKKYEYKGQENTNVLSEESEIAKIWTEYQEE